MEAVAPQTLKLELTIDTINAALTALSKFPYDQAAAHINAIQVAAAMAKGFAPPQPVDEGSEGGHAD